MTLQTVGPTLIRYGSEKQKDLFLQRILAGDVHFAIGYSEPDAGTDLASLRTTAPRIEGDGDHYVVNGQKLWTTGGHQADYVWLAVRTDPDAPKHQGISILIVDTRDPGYSWTPIITADGSHHVNATYFNDVRVPGRHAGRRGEPGLEADHHPAQPRAGDARPGRPDRGTARPGRRLGHQGRRRGAARRRAAARPGHRGLPRQRAAQLGGRPAPRPDGEISVATRRRPRSSPPTRFSTCSTS